MMAVDILPTAIPIDASKHFSDALFPYLTTLIEEFSLGKNNARSSSLSASAEKGSSIVNGTEGEGEPSSSLWGHTSALNKATVARGGELMKDHEWLRELVEPHVRLKLEFEAEGMGVGNMVRREASTSLPTGSTTTLQSPLPSSSSSPHLATQEINPGPVKATQSQSAAEASNSAAYTLYVSRMASKVAEEVNRRSGQSLIKKRVLLLGSGMVAQPVVDYLVCKAGMEVTIG